MPYNCRKSQEQSILPNAHATTPRLSRPSLFFTLQYGFSEETELGELITTTLLSSRDLRLKIKSVNIQKHHERIRSFHRVFTSGLYSTVNTTISVMITRN
jgi:hypothetical protein